MEPPGPKRELKRPPSPKRLATEERLKRAVGEVLRKSGVQGLGINAVAAEAKVDKVLIYRYFGGLPELLAAYGERTEFWPDLPELLGDDVSALLTGSYGDIAENLLRRYFAALTKRPVTLKLLAWECVESTPLTEALEAVRERRSETLFSALGEMGLVLPAQIRTAAILFSAALQYLAIRRRDLPVFGGLSIQDDRGMERIFSDIKKLFDALGASLQAD